MGIGTDITTLTANLADLEVAVGAIEGATDLHNKLTAARAALLNRLPLLAAGGAGELTPARAALLSNLDAAITSRAVPGDAMALTAAERLIVQALVINDLTPFPGADIPLIKTQSNKIANFEHEVEWTSTPVVEQVASVAATDLTAGSITPTFPTGATRVRVILVANIHAANFSAATHHIALTVQGKKNAGAYGNLIVLTAQTPIGLVNLDGAGDGWAGTVDVTALVDASDSTYQFKFIVDSDNAGAVNYTSSFVLVLVYRI